MILAILLLWQVSLISDYSCAGSLTALLHGTAIFYSRKHRVWHLIVDPIYVILSIEWLGYGSCLHIVFTHWNARTNLVVVLVRVVLSLDQVRVWAHHLLLSARPGADKAYSHGSEGVRPWVGHSFILFHWHRIDISDVLMIGSSTGKAQSICRLHIYSNRNLAIVSSLTIESPLVLQSTLRLRLFWCEGWNVISRLLLLILVNIDPTLLRRLTVWLLLTTICVIVASAGRWITSTDASNSRCLGHCTASCSCGCSTGSGRFSPSPPHLLTMHDIIVVLNFTDYTWLQSDTFSCSELRRSSL